MNGSAHLFVARTCVAFGYGLQPLNEVDDYFSWFVAVLRFFKVHVPWRKYCQGTKLTDSVKVLLHWAAECQLFPFCDRTRFKPRSGSCSETAEKACCLLRCSVYFCP